MTTQQLVLDIPPIVPAATRPLTIRDTLWTLESASGRREARPLIVHGLAGTWAARQWMHCGNTDGVLLVRWTDREQPHAVAYWTGLADGRVRLVVETPEHQP